MPEARLERTRKMYEASQPTYNHTREDSVLTPCPKCEALQKASMK